MVSKWTSKYYFAWDNKFGLPFLHTLNTIINTMVMMIFKLMKSVKKHKWKFRWVYLPLNVIVWILSWQVGDVIIDRLGTCTEEGKKVQRNGGKNFLAVFRRIEDSNWDQHFGLVINWNNCLIKSSVHGG